MTDLRKAAEMALDALHNIDQSNNYDAIEALRQALAQPEEKMRIDGSGKLTTKPYPDGYESERDFRKALAQPEQEPVAWVECAIIPWLQSKDTNVYAMTKLHRIPNEHYDTPLYTTPPKREWVGLTDDDLRQIILAAVGVAEAKLKEKNT